MDFKGSLILSLLRWISFPPCVRVVSLLFAIVVVPPFPSHAQNGSFNSAPTVVANSAKNGLSLTGAVAVDRYGNVFIADTGNNCMVEEPWDAKIDAYGAQKTIVNELSSPCSVAVDPEGDLFITQANSAQVIEYPRNRDKNTYSAPTTVGIDLHLPVALAVDAKENVYIADAGSNQVVFVPAGCNAASQPACAVQTTVGANLYGPAAIGFGAQGRVYIAATNCGTIVKIPAGCNAASDPPGATQTTVNEWTSPNDLAVDAAGSLYITHLSSNEVTEVPWIRVTASYGHPRR